MRCVLAILLLVLTGLLLTGIGGGLAAEQASLLRRSAKTSGMVDESRIVTANTGGYSAEIVYEYQVDDRTFTARRLTPIAVAGTRSWADAAVKRYPPGAPIEVYHSITSPSRAFIEPYTAFYPYAIILLGIGAFALAPALALAGGLFDFPPRVIKTSEVGWFELDELHNPAMRAMVYVTLAAAMVIVPVLVYLHYAATAGRFVSIWLIALLPFLVSAVVSIRTAIHTVRPLNAFRRVAVATTLEPVDLSKPVNVRVQLQADRAIVLEELRISLVCDYRSDFGSERWFIASHAPRTGYALTSDEPVIEKAAFEVTKTKRRSSSPFERLALPRLTWAVEVTAKVRGVGIYKMQHPFSAVHRVKQEKEENGNAV